MAAIGVRPRRPGRGDGGARGPHFCVGLDLKAMPGSDRAGRWRRRCPPVDGRPGPRSARAEILRLQASVTSVADCPKPVIAAIHGYCIGGGVDLVAACDIRLASADAVFSVRETKVAIVADLGSLQRLPASSGRATGRAGLHRQGHHRGAGQGDRPGQRRLPRRRRRRWPPPGPWPPRSPPTRRWPSRAPRPCWPAGEGRSVAEGLDYVATWNAGFLASDDLVEAMTAFMEKRPAEFTGN